MDVRNIESLQKAVEKCVSELGRIDFVMQVEYVADYFHNC